MDSNSKFFFKHPQYSEMIIYFEVIDLYLCGLELIKERFCGIASMLTQPYGLPSMESSETCRWSNDFSYSTTLADNSFS